MSERSPSAAHGSAATLGSAALAAAGAGGLSLVRARGAADALGLEAAQALPPLAVLAGGLGVLACTPLAQRAGRPLLLAGALALVAALLSLLAPLGLERLAGARGLLARTGLWLAAGPAAFALGGALAAALCARSSTAQRLALLGSSAAAGGLGHWVAGFLLVPSTGLSGAGSVGTAALIAGGVLAFALGRSGPDASPVPDAAGRTEPGAGLAALLLGAAALTWMRLGAREFALVAGPVAPTAWAFAAACLLLAGCGLLLAAARPGPWAAGVGALTAALGGLLALGSSPALAQTFGRLAAEPAGEGPPALRWTLGALALAAPLFGLGLAYGGLTRSRAGRGLSSAALGAAAAGLALELLAGPQGELDRRTLLILALALAPIAALVRVLRSGAPRPWGLGAAAAAGALALSLGPGPSSTSARALGAYLPPDDWRPLLEAELVREGPLEDRAVARHAASEPTGDTAPVLFVDGRPLPPASALPELARALHPSARSALIDRLGTGATARRLAELGLARLVVAEPGRAASEAAERFGPLPGSAGGPAVDFELVRVGLRPHLSARPAADARPESYDLILVDLTAPWLRGSTARCSRAFFEAAGARLAPYGLVLVELPAELWPGHLATVLATAIGVFPEALLLDAGAQDGSSSLLLALGARGVLPQRSELEEVQRRFDADPAVAEALGTADARRALVERVWLDREQLSAVTARLADADPIRDGVLHYELLSFPPPPPEYAEALRGATESLLLSATDLEYRRKLFTDWRCATEQLGALKTWKTRYLRAGDADRGLALVRLALAYDPDDPELMADALLFAEVDPATFERERGRLLRRSPAEFYRLGASLAQAGRVEEAVTVLSELTAAHPGSTIALAGLVEAHELAGDDEAAEAARARLAELDPLREALEAADGN